MSKERRRIPIARCRICSRLPNYAVQDLLEKTGGFPAAAAELLGLGGSDPESGSAECRYCGSRYEVSIDSGPGEWDRNFERVTPYDEATAEAQERQYQIDLNRYAVDLGSSVEGVRKSAVRHLTELLCDAANREALAGFIVNTRPAEPLAPLLDALLDPDRQSQLCQANAGVDPTGPLLGQLRGCRDGDDATAARGAAQLLDGMQAGVNAGVLAELQSHLPGWAELEPKGVAFEPPKGFSSFTMVVRPQVHVDPPGVLYRRLAGKDNAILEAEAERDVFLLLGRVGIAAACLYQDPGCRIEELLSGGTLTRQDVFDPEILRKVAVELHHFHHLEPPPLPEAGYFELLHAKWGPMARSVLQDQRDKFPAHERHLCDELLALVSDETRDAVQRMLPNGPLTFCHNDTYHGNVMKLDDGSVRLLDFEFSCMNHRAFDFSNLFAETVMRHGLPEEPHFDIAEPDFGREQIAVLVNHYLDCDPSLSPGDRESESERLVDETLQLIPLSDYMYAMAALPLAVLPIQKIRFLPYSHRRFRRFQAAAARL